MSGRWSSDWTGEVDEPDSNAGDGVCSGDPGVSCTLRAAVEEANALAGDDEIELPAGTYVLSLAGTGEEFAATGDLDVRENLTVRGAGAGVTILDGNDTDRVFDLIAGTLVLESSDTSRWSGVVGA